MPTILTSFIGKGRLASEGEGKYVKTTYCFTAEDGSTRYEEASFFGVALWRYLNATGRQVDRWLIMGTGQSMWDALTTEMLTGKDESTFYDQHMDLWAEVEQSARAGDINDALLHEWEDALKPFVQPTELSLRIVGAGDTIQSQLRIWEALVEVTEFGDDKVDIILDITHAFRHQPVIAAFMVTLLRWLRNVSNVELYYGAFEMACGGAECPVLHLKLVNELLQATEALATLRYTGSFMQLARVLRLNNEMRELIDSIAFREETNQQPRTDAERCLKQLHKLRSEEGNPIRRMLMDKLIEPLKWVHEETLAQRMAHRAEDAKRHGHYLKAIVLLYEALLVAACQMFKTGDPLTYDARQSAEERLNEHLIGTDKQTFKDIKDLRNTVAHGTVTQSEAVREALRSARKFRELFDDGMQLLKCLLERLKNSYIMHRHR
ncbi:MAG TPA: TIGR02221 family CRISPR-associated protein [Armatimonadetes bacterium]|nr:TIGR02221 family CRISPR-associated protein [Armatimonadota bacterium]